MKNIIICCDGTGNDFGDKNSNVVKLFSVLDKAPTRQVVYYDPGVGTPSTYSAFWPSTRLLMRVAGLGFGYGISQNVMDAYAFIMMHYEKGDKIYLFGFSRGAYTVRVVAGLINRCGLLYPNNTNVLGEAIRVYKNTDRASWRIADNFKKTFCQPAAKIEFLGIWDTVNSVGWIYSPTRFPFTTKNESVQAVRHALSIDERRAFFAQNLFAETSAEKQNIKQVWFAGVHSDVGGGYAVARSGLANITLEWMLVEAKSFGLEFDEVAAKKIVEEREGNHLDDQNEELKGGWYLGEFWPKLKSYPKNRIPPIIRWVYWFVKDDWVSTPYFNLFRRRNLKKLPRVLLHESVLKRLAERKDYRPSNLVKKDGSFKVKFEKEAWKRL